MISIDATRVSGSGAGATQQARFDAFAERFNLERPHQALGMKVPADVYARSPRVYRGLEELNLPVPRRDDHGDSLRPHLFQGPQGESQPRLRGAERWGDAGGRPHLWLVTFMQYDLVYFDDETCRLEPIENPFGPKVLPMSPE